MAVVKTEDVWLTTGDRFKLVVKFSASVKNKEQRFTCAYPPDVALALGETDAHGVDVEEVIAAWHEGLVKALESKKTVERVIVAEISTNGRIYRNGKVVFSTASGWRGGDKDTREALKIAVEVGVFDEATMVLGQSTRYSYTPVASAIPHAVYPSLRNNTENRVDYVYQRLYGDTDDDHIPEKLRLPWTEQNEQWFAGLVAATENVILKLNTLRKDRTKLLESISQGRLLMAAPEGS
jgi:hypothetical protein